MTTMVLGTISFQAHDKMDVFYVTQVIEDGVEVSHEAFIGVEESQFDSDKVWVTGYVPKIKPIHIEGDTASISGWFKGENFTNPFMITVYVECETAEELEAVIADETVEQERDNQYDFLNPFEINL